MKKQIFTLTLAAFCGIAVAQTTISLDTIFNQYGHKKTDYAQGVDLGNAVVGQPDGKIVVAGSADTASKRYAAFARLSTTGLYDNTFSSTGKRRIDLSTNMAEIWDIAIDANGRVVGVGSVNNNAQSLIMRLNAGSSIDGGFANSGKLISNVSNATHEVFYGVAIQTDGKILACGSSGVVNNKNFLLRRFTTTGLPDSTFDTEGIVTTDLGKVQHIGSKVLVQSDGKILVAGTAGNDLAILRYNSNGTPDNNFGLSGSVVKDFGYNEGAFGMAIQPDGKILIAGARLSGPSPSSILIRLNSDGKYDSTFASFGTFEFAFNGNSAGFAVEVLPNGKILMCSKSVVNGNTRVNLTLLKDDGTFDDSFSASEGSIVSNFYAAGENPSDMALLTGNRVAITGFCTGTGQFDMFTAVYLLDGTVGVLDFEQSVTTILAYPNPVVSQFNLNFELTEPQVLNISLVDITGRTVAAFAENKAFESGLNQNSFKLPEDIVPGHYILSVQGREGVKSIHMNVIH